MRTGIFLAAILWLLCWTPKVGAGEDNADKVLYVYTWEDFFAPEAVRLFEEKTGARVEFAFYESNDEMVETMRSGGGYDIVTSAGSSVEELRALGRLKRLDHALLPNLLHVETTSAGLNEDWKMEYSVPYTVTVAGIGYNRKMIPEDAVESWNIFADPRVRGRATVMAEPREALGAALKLLGYSVNTKSRDEVREAEEVLREWRKNISHFSINEAYRGLRDGKYAVVHAYHGDIGQIQDANPDVGFLVPREGGAFSVDKFVICEDSEHPELAHAFINHILEPKIAVLNMKAMKYYMPNRTAMPMMAQDAYSRPEMHLRPEVWMRCEILRYLEPEVLDIYEESWEDALLEEE